MVLKPSDLRSSGLMRLLVSLVLVLSLSAVGAATAPSTQAFAARSPKAAPTPTIAGAVTVGSTLTVTRGTWRPSGMRFTYRWRSDGAKIANATKKAFVLTRAQVGHRISVSVTGHKRGYKTVTRTSVQTASVPALSFPAATPPTITGSATYGSTLQAHPGSWGVSGATFTYQWLSNGTPVGGATGATYKVGLLNVGQAISVSVTGKATGYTTTTRTSASTAKVPALSFPAATPPTITGSATYGSTLQAHPGSWGVSGATFTYQWLSNGTPVGGATGATYKVDSLNIGQAISVSVTGKATGYTTTTKTSASTAKVPVPPITGTAATRTQKMSQSNLSSAQIGWYETGTVLTLICYQRGQSVKGYFSSSFNEGWDNLWYRISDGAYAADVDLETGTLDPVVPACADQPVADTTNAIVMATTQRMSDATLNSTQNGWYSAGSRLTLTCYTHGQAVKGYFSGSFPDGYDNLWYKVSDGQWVADVDIDTGSNDPVTPACSTPPPSPPSVSGDLVVRAKSWLDAKVQYNQGAYFTNQYGTYRQDCSGFVSMAMGLPKSYVTGTLPQVMHPITKDELQPGDFMLNTAGGNNGHVSIFMGWTDASHSHYRSWEENGAQGYAFEQVVPYPYWPHWAGTANYKPYRRN